MTRAESEMANGVPLDEQALLRQRAAALARRLDAVRTDAGVEHAAFRLARERYAIELGALVQIFPLRDLARLPGARPPLIGLTPWRGGLLRVIDLAVALGRPHSGIADQGRVLVIGDEDGREFGILVDAVQDVVALHADDVRSLAGEEVGASLLRGVTRDAVLILDAPEMLRRFG